MSAVHHNHPTHRKAALHAHFHNIRVISYSSLLEFSVSALLLARDSKQVYAMELQN